MKVDHQYRDAIALLAGFRRQRHVAGLQVWLLVTLTFLLFLTTSLVLLERISPGTMASRHLFLLLISYSWLGGAALLIGRVLFLFTIRRHNPSDLKLAQELGIRDKNVRDRLLNALQLHSSAESHQLYSADLIDQALIRIVPELPRDTKKLISRRRHKQGGRLLLLVVALQLLLVLLQGTPILSAFDRLVHYRTVFVDPDLITITLAPGDTTLIRGDNLLIEAFPAGTVIPEELELTLTRDGQQFLYPLRKGGQGFSLLLERINAPFMYHVSGERLLSDSGHVKLLDLPVITDFQANLTYPAYTGLLPLQLEHNIGSFSAVFSTSVAFTLKTSQEADVQLVLDNGEAIEMTPGDSCYQAQLVVREDRSYHFHLVDQNGLSNSDPIVWHITAVEDSHPLLNLSFPRDGDQVTKDVQFLGSGVDDYGITRFQLRYRLVPPFLQAEYADFNLTDATAEELAQWDRLELPFEKLDVGEALLDYTWNLGKTNALPEDEILLFVILWDNDTVSGPKWTRSPLLRLNLPGTAALYDAVQSSEEAELERTRDIIERSRENLEQLEQMVTELQVDPEQMNWEMQRQIESIAREQLEMAESAAAMQENLEQLQQSLEENQLFSDEVIEKMQQLSELLQELMTEEMKSLLEQLQEGNEPTPEELQAAMEQAKQELDAFLEQMERLLSILEQLQMEQKLEELARLAEELRQQQEELNEQAASDSPPDDLSEQQEKLAAATEELNKEIQQAKEEFGENPHFPAEQMDAASDFMEEQALAEQMMANAGQLEIDPSQSQPAGENIAGDLGQLQQMLQDASDMAGQNAMAELNDAIDRVIHRLLIISELFEVQRDDVTGLRPENASFGRCAFQQLSLTRALLISIEDVSDLMMESFFISRSVLTYLQKAAAKSELSIQDFEERRMHSLAGNEEQIMGFVNRAIYLLMQDQESMNASSSSTGFEEMMEQLMQCSSDQQSLNSQCNKLLSAQQGTCQKPMGVTLSDMASEQARLRQQMEQLAQQVSEMPGGRKPMGDLGEIARQMQEVEEQLQDSQLTERTLKLQERILNQLLDSQRSIRERERSQERESRTATLIERSSPEELMLEMSADALRQEMIRALREGYSREYLELIRDYYQHLMMLEENTRETRSIEETP